MKKNYSTNALAMAQLAIIFNIVAKTCEPVGANYRTHAPQAPTHSKDIDNFSNFSSILCRQNYLQQGNIATLMLAPRTKTVF